MKESGKSRQGAEAPTPDDGPMRIAKAIARAGLASRREAERFIAEGRVTLNGSPVTSPAVNVSASDAIVVDGKALPVAERPRLWRYHKPKGLVTTHSDPQGRPTVFQSLPPGLPRVISVGRLDFNTEGLLLLTNHGGLARHLELPSTGWLRRYRVRAYGNVKQEQLDRLKDGIELEGVRYGPIEANLEREQGSNVWLGIGLREGKNREVKKVLASLHLAVTRLIRVSFGPFALGDLAPGDAEEVKPRVIAEQVGAAFAAEIGIKVADPAPEPRRKASKTVAYSRPVSPSPLRGGARGGGDGRDDSSRKLSSASPHPAPSAPTSPSRGGGMKKRSNRDSKEKSRGDR